MDVDDISQHSRGNEDGDENGKEEDKFGLLLLSNIPPSLC
jgi:hypothetical protein